MRKKLSAVSYQPSAIGFQLSNAGFTLVELLITMTVFVLVIAAASQVFTGLLTQFKQQGKITESNIEGIIGLDLLRRDIEHAGYGLPWIIPAGITYYEASSSPANLFNDASNAPRAIVSRNAVTFFSGSNSIFNGSDYLVIKAVNVAMNDSSQKWTRVGSSNTVGEWTPRSERLSDGARVIVLWNPSDTNSRTLAVSGTNFFTTYNATNPDSLTNSAFAPTDASTRIVYGINDSSDPNTPKRPFNRADYFIQMPTGNLPQRCAANTGVLYKATMNHDTDGTLNYLPLLDCAADMQVVFRLDMNEDGTIGTYANADGSVVTTSEAATVTTVQATLADPSLLRKRLKEVRVYILAQEGQRDPYYTYPSGTILVGPPPPDANLGRSFSLGTNLNYRWKVYTIVVTPMNLL